MLQSFFAPIEIASRLDIEVSGTIISVEIVRPGKGLMGNSHRFYIKYVLAVSANGTTSEYHPGYTDSDLSQNLNVGAVLEKKRWELDYIVDGRRIADYPWLFYVAP